ncbi:MAG TPA: hypothetical protein DEA08_34005 [Planctomycetes bacterium]|nr:hypothetical protein [Planctomycetota bacterium]
MSQLRLSQLRLSQLRCVEWELEGADAPRRELVPAGEEELLCAAILRLHREPGVNPHSGRPTARLLRLAVGTPRLSRGPWWSGPALDDAGERARLVEWGWQTRHSEDEVDPPDPV